MGGIASVLAIWAFWPLGKVPHSRKQWKGWDGHSYGRTQQDWRRGRDGVFVSLLVKVHIEKKEKHLEIPKPHGFKIITSSTFRHLKFLFCTKLSLDWNWYRTSGGILHCVLGGFLMCLCVCVSSCETQERTTLRRVSLHNSQLFRFYSGFEMRQCMIRVCLYCFNGFDYCFLSAPIVLYLSNPFPQQLFYTLVPQLRQHPHKY